MIYTDVVCEVQPETEEKFDAKLANRTGKKNQYLAVYEMSIIIDVR